MRARRTKRISTDVGGTFTDVVLWDQDNGALEIGKVSSTPRDPSEGALNGIVSTLRGAGGDVSDLVFVGHGTTVATNAIVQGTGARTALITTRGFRDILEIRRLSRPAGYLYDPLCRLPAPLVPRSDRLEVTERVNAKGEVMTPLDETEVLQLARAIRARGIKSVAVCLLFSFIFPHHERAVKRVLERECPNVSISLSSDIMREYREYERSSTTVVTAYVRPLLGKYLARLEDELIRRGVGAPLYIMQSNGGLASPKIISELAASSLFSGPAGGVIAGQYTGKLLGFGNVINIDMGGTSFDVSLIVNGSPSATTHRKINEHPVGVPMLDIHTIGAGGGSLAYLDAGGGFRVGPQSAGAEPGPACYGRGGIEPTVTDANVVLGLSNPEYLLGGQMEIYPERAWQAAEGLASRLGHHVLTVAQGIRQVVNTAMVGAIRSVSIGKGYDPRDFALLAFGGAGPLHAVDLAAGIGIPWVIIPPNPGCHSAFGLLVTDMIHDQVQTYLIETTIVSAQDIDTFYREMTSRVNRDLEIDSVPEAQRTFLRSMDLRYVGQDFSLTVNLGDETITKESIVRAVRDFHGMHEAYYGYKVEGESVEIVNLRLRGLGYVTKPALRMIQQGTADSHHALLGTRKAYLDSSSSVEVGVYARDRLLARNVIQGPAIIEQLDSTTLVPSGWVATVEPYGNLIIGTRPWEGNGRHGGLA